MHCLECTRPARARGLCNTHYHRTRRALINDGINLFPEPAKVNTVAAARPTTCRYHACPRPAHLHDVCTTHLVDTLAAGHRATQHHPAHRLTLVTAGMSAAA